jgi:dinuclear metal center YbgI/SA1388 family protein
MASHGPVTVGDWVAALDELYPQAWAQPWDSVGLVVGDPAAEADQARFVIDVTEAVVDDAVAAGAGLIVAHHPLLYDPVHGVAETDPRGRIVSRLVRAGIALFTAHTNADAADPGVSDALAAVIGVGDTEPLDPLPPGDGVKLVTFVPTDRADELVDALSAAGAGTVGDYSRCAWTTAGVGTFVAGEDTDPAVGEPGRRTEVPETRVEMVVPSSGVAAVVRALRAVHPYEEPAYDLLPTLLRHGRGIGRVGELAVPESLADFTLRLAATIPTTGAGLRVAGDLHRQITRVALCGGSGSDLAGAALAAGADVYVTADWKHHDALDAAEQGLAVVDVAHWASEQPWLSDAAARTASLLHGRGLQVGTSVSTRVTDPWHAHEPTERITS